MAGTKDEMELFLHSARLLLILSFFAKPLYCAELLPFGPAKPNEQSEIVDDTEVVTVPLDVNLPYFETTYSTAYLIDAGRISFIFEEDHFSDPFPDNRPIIAPLWGDLVGSTEPLYWRQTSTDTSDLAAASIYVKTVYSNFDSFQATWTMVVTWHKFRKFGSNADNTFQAILATDGTLSFAIFLYQDVVALSTTTIGVNAGDDMNYYELCISRTNEVLNIEQHAMSKCGKYFVVFRMDSNNPDQGRYDCTTTYTDMDCDISYFCKENSVNPAFVDVVTTVERAGLLSIMAWDTQKYEDGVNPDPSDSDCETPEGATSPMTLIFTVDVDAAMPKCGVRVTGTTVKTLETTIRSYMSDKRFDTENDTVHRLTCTTDALLPHTIVQTKMFSDSQTTIIPQVSRTAELQVVVPGTSYVVSEVELGQSISLRIVYDNTAQNIPPYGVYVLKCSIADTMAFDGEVIDIIDEGCVVEQDPAKIWYISRSFQQTSLVEGLFIADTGVMSAAKFSNIDKIFLRCSIDVCFFHTVTPNLCDDSCEGTGVVRRKRSENQTSSIPEVLFTRLKVFQPEDTDSESDQAENKEPGCLKDTIVYIILSTIAGAVFVASAVTIALFFKVYRKLSLKRKQ